MSTTPAVQSQAMFPPTHIRAPESDNAPSAPTVRAATGDSPAEARGSTYTNPAMSVYVCRTAFLGEHSATRSVSHVILQRAGIQACVTWECLSPIPFAHMPTYLQT